MFECQLSVRQHVLIWPNCFPSAYIETSSIWGPYYGHCIDTDRNKTAIGPIPRYASTQMYVMLYPTANFERLAVYACIHHLISEIFSFADT